MIDAVVAIMAGAGGRDAKFNFAQAQAGKSSKKSKRTFASYLTGSNGMGRFLRPAGAHGYIGVAWDKDPLDGDHGTPFTAIIGAEALPERETEAVLNSDITRILVRGHIIGISDLQSSGKVLPAAQLIVALRSKYGSAAVRDFRTGAEYLATLYAYLKGDTNTVSREEADSAMKAFISAIAYRQPDDIDGLIREEILDEVDNEGLIQRLMETIREVTRLKTEAARMERNIGQLEAAEGDLRRAFDAFMDERLYKTMIDVRKAEEVREQVATKSEARDTQKLELDSIARTIEERKARQNGLQQQYADVQARKNIDKVHTTKKELDSVIAEQERTIQSVSIRIHDAVGVYQKALQSVGHMQSIVAAFPELVSQKNTVDTLARRFAKVSLLELDAAVKAVADRLGDQPLEIMKANCAALRMCLTEIWASAVDVDNGLRAAFAAAFQEVDRAHTEAVQQARDLLRRVEKLKSGAVDYPPAVEAFLPYLRKNIPQCNARVLCDVVDVKDQSWQAALEGYLGFDRFTILYDRSFEKDVVALAKAFRRENPGRSTTISVPQLSLAIDDHPPVEKESIVHLLKVNTDAEAEGYLKARYGRTVVVQDIARLRTTRSGVMKDGWSTQGYRYQQRRCSEDDLVLGAEMRRQLRERLLNRGKELEKEVSSLETRRKTLQRTFSISGPAAIALAADDPKRFDEAAELKRMAENDRSELDVSSLEKLENEAREIEEKLRILADDVEKLSIRTGALGEKIGTLNEQIAAHEVELSDLAPKAEKAAAAHEALMKQAFIERDEWPTRYKAEVGERFAIATYERRINDRSATAANRVSDTVTKLTAYNKDALDFQQVQIQNFAYEPRLPSDIVVLWMEEVWRQIREQIRAQKETGLPERKMQCEAAERSFTSSFTTDFCATVLSNVDGRHDTIDALNSNLSHINFGGDTFQLITALKPEYDDYTNLFRKIRALMETRKADLDLFNTSELSGPERDTLFRIRELLLDDKDMERALSELRRIADYRNYRSYDFERQRGGYKVALSKWGTGSGGESETPVYVIRVAVLASAFKIFSQQKKAHFRSIFMDEVFATMDESRTRRVLHFLKELGLQVVCAAPTRSMAAVLDEFDTRINFSKYETAQGDRSDVNVIELNTARVKERYDAHRRAVEEKAADTFDSSPEAALHAVNGKIGRAGSGTV